MDSYFASLLSDDSPILVSNPEVVSAAPAQTAPPQQEATRRHRGVNTETQRLKRVQGQLPLSFLTLQHKFQLASPGGEDLGERVDDAVPRKKQNEEEGIVGRTSLNPILERNREQGNASEF